MKEHLEPLYRHFANRTPSSLSFRNVLQRQHLKQTLERRPVPKLLKRRPQPNKVIKLRFVQHQVGNTDRHNPSDFLDPRPLQPSQFKQFLVHLENLSSLVNLNQTLSHSKNFYLLKMHKDQGMITANPGADSNNATIRDVSKMGLIMS